MICPKCKREIPENSLKCNHCGSRIASLCKKCNAYNSIYNIKCTNCGEELLKVCPSCKGINLPTAQKCRKCGIDFINKTVQPAPVAMPEEKSQLEFQEAKPEVSQEIPQEIKTHKVEEVTEKIQYSANFQSQQNAKDSLVKALISGNSKIISLSGDKGAGKSLVLRTAIHSLKENPITWLFGECSNTSQISPCGLIQNILLNFFNITNFCSDGLKLKKDSQKFFHSEFPMLSNDEVFALLNFLYPTSGDYFENILINKEKTFTFLKKVFQTIIDNSETVFVIENFEMIDGMSYEFLYRLLEADFISQRFKILLTYNELRPAKGYFYNKNINDNNYVDLSLSPFDLAQSKTFINQYLKESSTCTEELKDNIFELTKGNPAFLEQVCSFMNEVYEKWQNYNFNYPYSFNETVSIRLDNLKQENSVALEILAAASIHGTRFYPSILNQIFELSEDEFVSHLIELQKRNFISKVNEFTYEIKNSMLWEAIFEYFKGSETIAIFNEKLFSIYSIYTLSSASSIAVIAQNLNQKLAALNIWTEVIKLAAYIGDVNLYVIAQKQCLNFVDQIEKTNSSLIKNNIYERLGKVLAQTNPKEAMLYLPAAVANAKNLETPIKQIELTAYLASCCMTLGDYYGTIECVNSVLERLDFNYELEIAILKSRKLDALLKIGNCGEIVNLIDNEIMPVFDKYISSKSHKNVSIQKLYAAWLKSYLILANALVFQGNNRAFEVVSTLFDIMQKNNFNEPIFIAKVKLAAALAHTIRGEVEKSEDILEEIIKQNQSDNLDNEAISRWNLINILNNFILKKYNGLKEELFDVVTFANNVNDNFTKNILKTILGKILKDEENTVRATEIYNDQITFFAKEKNAIGALLTWYFIADINLITEGPEKAIDVALKALDVAQSTKINNYYFITLYNKILAEAYIMQAEFELAKIHIEKAVMVARKFELLDLLARLYHLYGKYLQELAIGKSDSQVDFVTGAYKMYKKATALSQTLKNNYVLEEIASSENKLNAFCRLNGIVIK
ncbi:MAG TPA: hypothetical protein PLG15_00990 [Candidatus Gastranaerophilaceae bacterium]|nr:hypothetical protein [Candidatus Gastranaerophilaceae bacterium]